MKDKENTTIEKVIVVDTNNKNSSLNSNNYYIKNSNLDYYNSNYISKKENTLIALSVSLYYIYYRY